MKKEVTWSRREKQKGREKKGGVKDRERVDENKNEGDRQVVIER